MKVLIVQMNSLTSEISTARHSRYFWSVFGIFRYLLYRRRYRYRYLKIPRYRFGIGITDPDLVCGHQVQVLTRPSVRGPDPESN